jgi:hypothetical protein
VNLLRRYLDARARAAAIVAATPAPEPAPARWAEALTTLDIEHEGLRIPLGTPGVARPHPGGYELVLSFLVLPNDLIVAATPPPPYDHQRDGL